MKKLQFRPHFIHKQNAEKVKITQMPNFLIFKYGFKMEELD